ncbi:hypothetical protein HanXRQr2_Chr09g0410611 [Helianthus annuus]|uniref:Uncharacterized protein n=1 Tax=Helianthus annuus TaxID=4232 RepID=A0A9K3NAN2_HELAN|nr:hypothetical protein HanXRQr2_Chr09g0410611 [Helianthus annuus]
MFSCKPSIRMRRVVGTAAISLRILLQFKYFGVYWAFFLKIDRCDSTFASYYF